MITCSKNISETVKNLAAQTTIKALKIYGKVQVERRQMFEDMRTSYKTLITCKTLHIYSKMLMQVTA